MKYECKAVKYTIYAENENPVFGDTVLTVELDDEAAGPFLVFSGHSAENGNLAVDFKQWAAIDKAARQLIKDFDYE